MIFTIFKKELKDTLRDKRTLIMMLVIPILIFPIILNIFVGVSASFTEEALNKKVNIGIVGDKDSYLVDKLSYPLPEMGEKELIFINDTSEVQKLIQSDSLQFALYVSPDFDANMSAKKPAQATIYYDATNMGMQDRAQAYISMIEGIAQQE